MESQEEVETEYRIRIRRGAQGTFVEAGTSTGDEWHPVAASTSTGASEVDALIEAAITFESNYPEQINRGLNGPFSR